MISEHSHKSLQYIKGVGPKVYERLKKKGLRTVKDALYYFPKNYQDRRTLHEMGSITREGTYLVKGKIVRAGEIRFHSGSRCFEVVAEDASGSISLKWLNYKLGKWKAIYTEGKDILVFGSTSYYQGRLEFLHPEVSFPDQKGLFYSHEINAIVPLYPEIDGIHQKVLRKIILNVVNGYGPRIKDPVPEYILSRENLPSLGEAIMKIHLPDEHIDLAACLNFTSTYHKRIIYDEFFSLQLGIGMRRLKDKTERGIPISWERGIVEEVKRRLPFQLTVAQRESINSILKDMKKGEPMRRLLQGDVGSGKTIVAWVAAMMVWFRGHQVALMAPTEILAEQHYRNFSSLSSGLELQVTLLTASLSGKEKKMAKKEISRGKSNIVIGTHALIQEDVLFHDLALVVVDEQHRFGVYQRLQLKQKGASPHLLVMTATPIPRTLAMTVYGDLDISLIDELPPGRIPVETRIVNENERGELYEFIRSEVISGGQVYVVCPLVEESEKVDFKAAKEVHEHLKLHVFPGLEVELIHGRMRGEEKESIISRFRDGGVSILVSTTVIEVGIDVPTANVMVVEHAERFGLSQLHQLRGRVGRGGKKSFCILLCGEHVTDEARKRLDVMVSTSDGFKIAEEDLKIRGPGDFIGARQSGLPDLIFGNIIRDSRILTLARETATEVLEDDPDLRKPAHRDLRLFLTSTWGDRMDFAFV